MTSSRVILALVVATCLSGCASHAVPPLAASGPESSYVTGPSDPAIAKSSEQAVVLLKKSMDMYKGLRSFDASYSWNDALSNQNLLAKRTIEYIAPNKYKAVTKMNAGTKLTVNITSVSDGKKGLDFTNLDSRGESYAAAPSLDLAPYAMRNTFQCGSALFRFFRGSSGYAGMVDESNGPVTLGNEEREPNESARHIKFYATGALGHTDALIGEKSLKVYAISYDSEPFIAQLVSSGRSGVPTSSLTKEIFTQVQLNPTIPESQFAPIAPKGLPVVDASEMGQPEAPIPTGVAAPDVRLTPLKGGAPVSLSSLRGKPVLVDFWATWCGPCKMSLPHTQALYNDFKSKGLQVLVVSDEDAPTIQAFIEQNKYTFPVYRDLGDAAQKTYKVQGIPTVLIIDKTGKLQSYMVGLQDESTLREALKKVGVE